MHFDNVLEVSDGIWRCGCALEVKGCTNVGSIPYNGFGCLGMQLFELDMVDLSDKRFNHLLIVIGSPYISKQILYTLPLWLPSFFHVEKILKEKERSKLYNFLLDLLIKVEALQ